MRILVLNPSFGRDFCRSARWAARSRGRVQRHPDWLLTAVAVLERAGHAVLFIDAAALNIEEVEVVHRAAIFKPELAVLHTTTPSIYSDINHAALLKAKTGCKVALVGNHVTAEPQDTLRIAGENVDYLVKGEYDNALLEIAEGRATKTIVEAPVDVGQLPFPAWHHIDPWTYRDFGKRTPFLTLLSGRGCFAKCTFCTDPQTIETEGLRFRSSEAVVDEMEQDYRQFPFLKEIMFETDTFTASPAHVNGICEEILKRNLKTVFSANARVDMNLSLFPILKRAGLRQLVVGYEFGTQEALDSVKKGITLEQSLRFSEVARKHGIQLHGCFMFGAPGETKESARKTIEFAQSLPLNSAQFSGICVYPGTVLFDWAKHHGFLVPKDWRDWVDENHEQVTLLSYPQFSKDEIDRSVNKALKAFYLRPIQMLRMLWNSRLPSEWPRLWHGFCSFLDSVVTVRR